MHFLSRRTDEGTSFKKGSLDVHSSNYSISYDSSSIYFLLLNENIAQKTFTSLRACMGTLKETEVSDWKENIYLSFIRS